MSIKLSLLLEDINEQVEMEGLLSTLVNKLKGKQEKLDNISKKHKEHPTKKAEGTREILFTLSATPYLYSVKTVNDLMEQAALGEAIVKAQVKVIEEITKVLNKAKQEVGDDGLYIVEGELGEAITKAINEHKLNKHSVFGSSYKTNKTPPEIPTRPHGHTWKLPLHFKETELNTIMGHLDSAIDAGGKVPLHHLLAEVAVAKPRSALAKLLSKAKYYELIDKEISNLLSTVDKISHVRNIIFFMMDDERKAQLEQES